MKHIYETSLVVANRAFGGSDQYVEAHEQIWRKFEFATLCHHQKKSFCFFLIAFFDFFMDHLSNSVIISKEMSLYSSVVKERFDVIMSGLTFHISFWVCATLICGAIWWWKSDSCLRVQNDCYTMTKDDAWYYIFGGHDDVRLNDQNNTLLNALK